jgi:hypothetical protein
MDFRRIPVVLVAVLIGAACSSTPAGSDLIGTWTYTSGTSTLTCSGKSTTTQVTGNITIAEGIQSGTIVIIGPNCTTTEDVSGSSATALPGQTCTETTSGVMDVATITSLTLTLDDGVLSLTSGSTDVLSEGGASTDCTGTITATLMQVAK